MAAATALFTERGFDAPTVDEIAEAADVAKGTIYNYFDSKEAILFEFLIELQEGVREELESFKEAPGPLAAILEAWLKRQLEVQRPHLEFVRVFLSQLVLRAESFEDQVLRIQKHVDEPMMELLERLQGRGLIPAEVELERVVVELKSMHFGLSCLWAMEGPPFELTYRALATQATAFSEAVEGGLT